MGVANKLDFIYQQYENNRLSHAFLIETNNIDACYEDLKEIISKINTTDEYDKEYLDKLIELNNLPSLVVISPLKMTITKEQLENLEVKFSTKPVYSKFNTYVILSAEKMNESSGNSILKFLEEPTDDIIGFILTTNKENVLSTIRSRCEIFHVNYDVQTKEDEEMIQVVDTYLDKIFNTKDYLVNKEIILSSYSDRESIEKILLIIFNRYYNKYHESTATQEVFTECKIIIDIVKDKLEKLRNNVNIELILDSLVIELRRLK